MLNQYQKQIIRTAVAKASDKSAEIKKLSDGMQVPVEEIQLVLDRVEAVNNAAHSMAPQPKVEKPTPAAPSLIPDHPKKLRGSQKGRIFWTPEMIQQLESLRKKGETFPKIAEIMGLDVKQVSNKATRKPDKRKEDVSNFTKGGIVDKHDPQPIHKDIPEIVIPLTPPKIIMTSVITSLTSFIKDTFGVETICVFASNEANRASCTFEVGSVVYSLKLEVME